MAGRQPETEPARWFRPYWDQLSHKMDVSCGTNDSVILHALEPVLAHIGPTVATFMRADGISSSAAHDLLSLWLSSTLDSAADLGTAYNRCFGYLEPQPMWDAQTQRRVRILLLTCLRSAASRLPPADVVAHLVASARVADDDAAAWQLISDTGLTVSATGLSAGQRASLRRVIRQASEQLGEGS